MKKKNLQQFLLFVFLIFGLLVKGQVLVEKEMDFLGFAGKSSASIDQVYNNEDQMVLSLVLSEKFNGAKRSMDRAYQMKTADGKVFNLEKNQNPIGFCKNHLYSYTPDFENQQNIYAVQSTDKALSAKKNTLALSFSSTAKVLDTGDIIITEGGHSGRDWASLYSKDLVELHKFQPFNDESSIRYAANKDYIAYVGQIEEDSVIRVGLYSAAMFKKRIAIEQVSIDSNHMVSSVSLDQNYVLLLLVDVTTGLNQIMVLNKDLNEVSKIELQERISHNKLIALDGKVFFSTPKNIQCLDILEGTKDWSFKRENSNAIKTEKGYQFYGGELFFLDDEHLLFLEGQYEDGQNEVKDNTLKIIVCTDGEKIQDIKLGDFNDDLTLAMDKSTISIFSKNKILVYEKN